MKISWMIQGDHCLVKVSVTIIHILINLILIQIDLSTISAPGPCTTAWTTRCLNELPRLSFLRPNSEKQRGPPPADLQPGYDQFQFECCKFSDWWFSISAAMVLIQVP